MSVKDIFEVIGFLWHGYKAEIDREVCEHRAAARGKKANEAKDDKEDFRTLLVIG